MRMLISSFFENAGAQTDPFNKNLIPVEIFALYWMCVQIKVKLNSVWLKIFMCMKQTVMSAALQNLFSQTTRTP